MLRSIQRLRYFVPKRFVSSKVITFADRNYFPPEEKNVVSSSYSDKVVVPQIRLDEYVWDNCKHWPNHPAVICGITGRQYTYAQLRDKSAKLACALHVTLGIRPGDVVAICLPNLPEWPIVSLGSLEAGAVVTTLNPIYTAEEIVNQLIITSAKAILCTVDHYPTIQKALQMVQHPIKPIVIKMNQNDLIPAGAIDFYDFVDNQEIFSFENPRNCQDVAILPFSSGTTGLPKGVELTHFNIIANLEQMNGNIYPDIPLTKMATANFQESNPSFLPYFHIYGMVRALFAQLIVGCKLITLPKFSPDLFLNTLIDYKATILQVVPPVAIFCATFEGATPKHFERVWSISSGAAPLKQEDVERFRLKAPHILFAQGYGMTETSPVTHSSRLSTNNFESIGSPLPATQAKVVALDGSSLKGLGRGRVGEILVRGPQIMQGYFMNPEASAEVLLDGGWLRTGDVGFYDDYFEFFITDRKKELIKVKGYQVAPAEVEGVIRQHPDVADAGVIGVKHDLLGEVPKAFVVLKKGSSAKAEEIQKFVEKKVAEYKRIAGGVVFLDQIPKTTTGKILRRYLKEQYGQ